MTSISLINLTQKEIKHMYHYRVQNLSHKKRGNKICMEAQCGFIKAIVILNGGLKGSRYQNKCLVCMIIQLIDRKERTQF